MVKYLILGATGMAGHMISMYLSEQGHDVTTVSRRPFTICRNIICDATETKRLGGIIAAGNYDVLINCFGILNKEAEEHKADAVFINSYIPYYLSNAAAANGARLIHLSTDCVFSGRKGGYRESDIKDGETFYDRTKALGELINHRDLTFRTSIIGPDMNPDGIGLFNWFMKQSGSIKGYKNAIWTGVTTLELAKAIEQVSRTELTGLYHLVNNDSISKYELLCLFKEAFGRNCVEIQPFDNDRVDKSLINTRNDFDYRVPSYAKMVQDMAEWVYSHKELYLHYIK